MKDHIVITVSDTCGSRYYSIRKSTKILFYLVVSGAGLAIIGSIWANTYQNVQYQALNQQNQQLETELLAIDIENSKLNQIINKNL